MIGVLSGADSLQVPKYLIGVVVHTLHSHSQVACLIDNYLSHIFQTGTHEDIHHVLCQRSMLITIP